ncbi:NADH-binding protein [Geoanaerobacter pelophilus]|uniref:NADH-binding protein n=1 Tax=Geoanaerobacter pelophilus TaxID=60036 RepID=A0ABQ0MLH2_9BACT|nr:NAD(P)H-binding protein [Geoanaerobacter pelophilus]GAW67920.1 NADH-binding protein [Geoanaerobacter pelophilus]
MSSSDSKKAMVLVTGATGFIGKRLVAALAAQGIPVRCLVRNPKSTLPPCAEVVHGDLLQVETLDRALEGIETAYYLVHAMSGDRAGFERRDREAAENFVAAATRQGLRRVIYLGGLGEEKDDLSEHLASRLEVARILQRGPFNTTYLRAAVIIGAGGASFEMIRALVERLPVMITPRWVSTRCQFIAVRDVIAYLVGCLLHEQTAGKTYDIGGPEILSYREMMKRFARIEQKFIKILPVPFLTPKLSSYWVWLVTPIKPSISSPLIEGLGNEVVCHDDEIRKVIPLRLTGYDDAVREALEEAGALPAEPN